MKIDDVICASCFKYNDCKKYEKAKNYSLRRCQRAIEEMYYTNVTNKDVLEVGCGTKEKGGFIKKIAEANNCRWVGIDILKTNLATYVCSVERMPFEDKSFDYVIGSQTLEHWKKPKRALREIHRVLRDDGKVSLTAPIHLHGTNNFVSGNFNAIEKIFLKSGFNIEIFETWRKSYSDLEPNCPNDYVKKYLRKAGIRNFNQISTYIIHCVLSKSKEKVKVGFWERIFGN